MDSILFDDLRAYWINGVKSCHPLNGLAATLNSTDDVIEFILGNTVVLSALVRTNNSRLEYFNYDTNERIIQHTTLPDINNSIKTSLDSFLVNDAVKFLKARQ